LRQRNYGDEHMDAGDDVTYEYKRIDGASDLKDNDRCVWLRIDGSEVGDHDFLLFINMDANAHRFSVPSRDEAEWARIIDTASWAEADCNRWPVGEAERITGDYEVAAFSLAVLEEISRTE